MATASLSDQMGAMSVVDDLRHRQMVVQEHLNLPQRRAEVAERIRAYYQSQNIVVEEALVEEGVRSYFDKRLTFEAPRQGKLARRLAMLYIGRQRWGRPVAMVAIALGVLGGGSYMMQQAQHAKETEAVIASATSARAQGEALQKELRRQSDKVADLQRRLSATPLPAGSRMVASVSDRLATAKTLATPPIPGNVTAGTRDADRERVNSITAELTQADGLLKGTAARLADIDALIAVADRFSNMIKSAAYVDTRSAFPALQDAEREARQRIADADQNGVDAADKAVSQLTTMTSDAARVTDLSKELDAAAARFASMGLSDEEMQQVANLSSAGASAIKRLDAQAAQEAVKRLDALYSFAQTPLTLTIVDRVGEKSGVERRYQTSGGKSRFLVAEALDPSGRAVSIPITSAETGETKQANLFAVRVPPEEYERARQDKQDDGHIDDRVLGEKPAGSLTVRYARGIADQPDFILEW